MSYVSDNDVATLDVNSKFNLNLCEAIEYCKNSNALAARIGWEHNEKVAYQKGYPKGICNKQTADTWHMREGTTFRCMPYLQKRTVECNYIMWQPTLEDLLAKDWYVIIPCGL